MPADQGLIDSVANANTKTIAEAAAFFMAQGFQIHSQHMSNIMAHQNRLAILAETAMAKSVEMLQNIGVDEAAAMNKIATGNDLAQQLSALLTALNSGQQGVKASQTTPPVTP